MTADHFSKLLAYNPHTGVLRWLVNRTRVSIGTVAGCINNRGYVGIRVLGREYKAHRIAWILTYGHWPEGDIDHINGIKSDNRLSNLRDVTRRVNCQNKRRPRSDSTTGLLGVSRNGARFRASICVVGYRLNLGTFVSATDAAGAYLSAKRKLHEGSML